MPAEHRGGEVHVCEIVMDDSFQSSANTVCIHIRAMCPARANGLVDMND